MEYGTLNEFAYDKNNYKGQNPWSSWVSAELNSDNPDLTEFYPLIEENLKFRREGWDRIKHNFEKSEDKTVIDATLYRTLPNEVTRRVCKEIGIKFDENMISEWKNQFDAGHGQTTTHYNSKSGNSTAIRPPKEKCIKLQYLPQIYQDYVTSIALPNYIYLLSHRNDFHCEEDIEAVLQRDIDKKSTITQIDPVFAYSLVVTAKDIATTKRQEYLNNIYNSQDGFRNIFEVIDKIVDEQRGRE